MGNTGVDGGYSCKVAPNGNVYVTGRFSGTVDIDPGAGVHNITSSGLTDIFLACYTPAGAYVWGFGIGSANYDGGNALAVDAASNVIVVGFFQGAADFDPGAGITTMPFSGGTGLAYEGDGFVAKYSSTGAFQWAKDLGGTTVYDFTYAAATDDVGNVYIGGEYYGSMVVSPSITFSGTNGCGYIIKYSPSGTVLWAHNFGAANVDAATLTMVIKGGFIYTTGAFRGTADLYPWGTHVIFSAMAGVGSLDAFVAKYTTDGDMVFAKQIGGSGIENFTYGGLTLDAADNIYVAGYTKSATMTFDVPSPATSTYTAPGGGVSNFDIFAAKYSNTGAYQWGMILGSSGDDFARYIDVSGGYLYITGDFKNTVDMDPSAGIVSLVSSGGADMFLTKYDLSRNYICGFRVGTAGVDDGGAGLTHDTAGQVYTTGHFGGVATDFDPTATVYPLTSAGSTDGYLAKYEYTGPPLYTGTLIGDTICAGQNAYLTLTITSGPAGPYSITYTNGLATFSNTGVTSGVPFLVSPSPSATATYTVTAAVYTGGIVCSPPTVVVTTPATVLVTSLNALIAAPVISCNDVIYATGTTGSIYNWSFGDGFYGTGTPVTHTYSGPGIYTATLSVTQGVCSASDTSVVTIIAPAAITGLAAICQGGATTFANSTAGGTWVSGNGAVAIVGSASGIITGTGPGTSVISYLLPGGCFVTKVVTVNALPVITGSFNICAGSSTVLNSSIPGSTWISSNASVATIGGTTGIVAGTSVGTTVITCYAPATGCFATTVVTVNPVPGAITGLFTLCSGASATLLDASTGGIWTSSSAPVASIGSASGLVLAVAVGTTRITYSLPGGCFVTAVLTVSPLPGAVSGVMSVCQGSTIALSNSMTGGTWASSSAGVATVGSLSGIVSGISVGTAVISYGNFVTGCYVTTVVTVTGVPAAITGVMAICNGQSTTLSSAPAGATWSSSNPVTATIGSSTGIVTGVNAGTAIITCYNSSACYAVATVTVNPIPANIAGALLVCAGSTTNLSSITGSGIWTSSNAGVASIGSLSGVVSGIVAGTTMISYTLPVSGCFVTAVVTVTAVPTIITGTMTVCQGQTTTLSCATAGVTWSSSNPAVATIGLFTGVVTGINAGTAIITCYGSSGCYITAIVTVNPLPSNISGVLSVCAGSTTSLSSIPVGGIWTSSNVIVASIGSSSGIVYGIAAGTTVISYTVPLTGCYVTETVTVYPLPSVITGGAVICQGATINLTSSPAGGIWSSASPTVASVGPGTGTVTGLSSGTSSVTYSLSSGCFIATVVSVNPLPQPIAGAMAICVGNTTVLTSTTPAGSWSSTNASVALIGSSTGTATGVGAGTSVITYAIAATGCHVTAVISVNAIPSPISGITEICQGLTTTLASSPAGGVWYSSNAGVAATGSASGIVLGITAGTSTITYESAAGCYVTTVVTINPAPALIAGGLILCQGSTTALLNAVLGGTWTSGNATIASINSATGLVSALSVGTSTITYTLSPSGCYTTAVFTVTPAPGSIVGPNEVCAGATITLSDPIAGGFWSSSNIAIANVGTASGVVNGVTAGSVNITYTISTGCFVIMPVTVNPAPGPMSGINSICPGSVTTLGNTVPGGVWTSSTATVATVGSVSGLVTAILSGTTSISYSVGSCSASIIFTVYPVPVPTTGVLHTCTGYATALNNATIGGGTWSSSATSIATIGLLTGIVSGISPGTSIITFISAVTGCSVTVIVTIDATPPSIAGVAILCVGTSTVLSNSMPGGTWNTTVGGAVSVNAVTGNVIGVSNGVFNVTYSTASGCYASIPVTVNPLPLPITGDSVICEGGITVMHDAIPGGTWSCSPATVATVNSATGVVTSVSTGTAVITYTTGSGCMITTVITVNVPPSLISGTLTVCVSNISALSDPTPGGTWSSSVTSIAGVSASGTVSGISVGTSVISYILSPQCYATAVVTVISTPSAISGVLSICTGGVTTLSNAYPGGIWTSLASAVININSSTGQVTGIAAGTAGVTYTLAGGCSRTAIVTVNPLPAPVVSTPSLCIGSSTTVSSTIPGGTWISVNPSIAAVGISSGLVDGLATGTALISYTTPAGCVATFIVTVNTLPTSIAGSTTLCSGTSTTLATGSTGGIWLSGNTAVATITAAGVLNGIGPGVADISYALPTGCYRVVTVTVNPLPTPISGGPIVCAGGLPITLSDGIAGGVWTSSNPAVATVTIGSGIVNGYVPGTSVITYSLSTGCYVTTPIIVSPPPAAIAGPGEVCLGGTIVLTNATTGGLWSSANSAVAVVNTYTGGVAGVGMGIATISYTLPGGCFSSKEVIVHPVPAIIVPATSIACRNAQVAVTAWGLGTGGSYIWSPGAGLSCTGCATTLASPTANTIYTVTGTDTYGCSITVQTEVIIDTLMGVLSITGRDSICIGGCDTLHANGYDGIFSHWSPTTGTGCVNCSSTSVCIETDMTYYAVAEDAVGCTDSASFRVTVMPLPQLEVNPSPVTLCPDESKQVQVSDGSGNIGTTYQWLPRNDLSCADCSNPLVRGVSDLVYTVTGTTNFGCTNAKELPVSILPRFENTISNDVFICSGASVQLLATTSRPNPTFWWISPAGMNDVRTADAVVRPDTTTTYFVAISPKSCTDDTEKVTVYVEQTPIIALTPSLTALAGTTVTLNAIVTNVPGYPSYSWSPKEYVTCASCLTTEVIPAADGTYTFTVTSDRGCKASADVRVRYSCEGSEVFIPNTFTPNNDGVNDAFYVSATGISRVTHMVVFDRWGEMVFETRNVIPNDPSKGWDGTFRNKRLGHDVFIYVIDVECEFGAKFTYKGDIAIVR